jgi:hypothetical protein
MAGGGEAIYGPTRSPVRALSFSIYYPIKLFHFRYKSFRDNILMQGEWSGDGGGGIQSRPKQWRIRKKTKKVLKTKL